MKLFEHYMRYCNECKCYGACSNKELNKYNNCTIWKPSEEFEEEQRVVNKDW